MFNVIRFYQDYHIDHADSGSKHTRDGWVNTHCPFCHGMDYHLGVHLKSGAVKCWKCGTHSMISVIKELLGCDYEAAKDIHESYDSKSRPSSRSEGEAKGKPHASVCNFPVGTKSLTIRGKEYLRERGFDPEKLEKVWDLRETGPLGDYKFRIIAPIYVKGRMVSYQGRDYTGRSDLRYKACKQEDEVIPHQEVVYGLDLVRGDACVVVEGIADAWRMGPGSVCCFGTAFTLSQVNFIADRMEYVYILFDNDGTNAQAMARELALLLTARGVKVEILDISDTPADYLVDPEKGIDPGNLQQEYADDIMKELGL